VEAPTPLVHIIKVNEKRNRHVRAPKSNRKSVPSGRGSPRWIISRRDCERGVKNTCAAQSRGVSLEAQTEGLKVRGLKAVWNIKPYGSEEGIAKQGKENLMKMITC